LSSVIIDIGELRDTYSGEIEELEKFLKTKVKAKIEVANREITFKPSDKGEIPRKDYLRVLLKKYLHQANLKDEFRIIAGKENTLMIKGRKMAEESE